MPNDAALYPAEVEKMERLLLKTEARIIEQISNKRQRNLLTYAEERSLARVQEILQEMTDEAGEYAPAIVEKSYMSGREQKQRVSQPPAFSIPEMAVMERLANNLIGTVIEASITVDATIHSRWRRAQFLGRMGADVYRRGALEAVAEITASGEGISAARAIFLEEMKQKGVTAFVDKSGKQWGLHAYGTMATRATARQSGNAATFYADAEHDLYRCSTHFPTCHICAPLQGRVYSKSGNHPIYPPLVKCFGLVDTAGPETLENSWLIIHPNCLHVFTKFYEEAHSEDELAEIRAFSSFVSNPLDVNPRTAEETAAYNGRMSGRQKLLQDYHQWQRYRLVIPNQVPKTFQTFLKHKVAHDNQYALYMKHYRAANKQLKNTAEKGA